MKKMIAVRCIALLISAAIPVWLAFFTDQFEIWKLDQTHRFDVPPFVLGTLAISSLYQMVIALIAFLDGTVKQAQIDTQNKEKE